MDNERYRQMRLFTIAQMAATLKAGMMANAWNAEHEADLIEPAPGVFAKLATQLFDAVEQNEAVAS